MSRQAPWLVPAEELTAFGPTTFSKATAAVNGATGPIAAWYFTPMRMFGANGPLTNVGALASNGTGFTVSWLRGK